MKDYNHEYMQLAIELAKKGAGRTSPNPLVGAVIVKNGEIIGHGYHEKYGELHAERNALKSCTDSPEGATLYVTLEPCCHYGKTPPCTEAIIENKIRKVYIGSRDPNPKVAGKGVKILKEAGIEVIEDFMKEECDKINEIFFHYITAGTPYVTLKYAMTLDGKIATHTGASKWITGDAARQHVHENRNRYSAVMVGVNTVITDNPMLTCRIPGGRNPLRIICDTHLKTPVNAEILNTEDAETIIATCCRDSAKQIPFIKRGCKIIECASDDAGHVDLKELMHHLGKLKIDSIILEGGASMHWSALKAGIVNNIQAYIAPKLFGGYDALSPVGGTGVDIPDDAVLLTDKRITLLGDDILIEGRCKNVYGNS